MNESRLFMKPTALCDRKLGHGRLRGLDFDKFLTGLCWDRIASVAAVLDVKLNCLADIGKRFGAIAALTNTPCQRRDASDVAAI